MCYRNGICHVFLSVSEEYKGIAGEDLPYQQLGFKYLMTFVDTVPDAGHITWVVSHTHYDNTPMYNVRRISSC